MVTEFLEKIPTSRVNNSRRLRIGSAKFVRCYFHKNKNKVNKKIKSHSPTSLL